LLDVSRIGRGKIELHREKLPLSAIIHLALETSRPNIEANRHELVVSLPQAPVYVDGDLTRLAQVMSNLLNNAAKYTPAGGRIELSASTVEKSIVLRIRDNGIGIPPHMLTKIFEMFAQVDSGLNRSNGGLGIGLTLVRRLVELHGGSITANSAGSGQGSEFVVRLPMAFPDPVREPVKEKPDQPVIACRRLLIVDDNEDAAALLAMLLRMDGHDVRTCNNGALALQIAGEFRPEAALLDLGLPGMNGYELAVRIREQPWGKGMLLVAITGWGQEDDRRRSKEAGFDRHLVKPVTSSMIHEVLNEIGR